MNAGSLLRSLRRGPPDLRARDTVLLAEYWLRLLHLGGLRILSPCRLPALAALPDRGSRATGHGGPRRDEDHVVRVLRWAARLQPIRVTCLCHAIVLRDCLRRRRIPACLRIGVGRAEAPFPAHAWVEVNGRIVGDPAGEVQGFRALRHAVRP
ncbi:MAG: lasso peptide biosynthesis B2 protein [Planctomycetes bacterium]|nr:lasso peptide biosynthesis B2 protein [Planctomycetota bacterium]